MQPRKTSGSTVFVVVFGGMTCRESEVSAAQVESLISCATAAAPGASVIRVGAPEDRTDLPIGLLPRNSWIPGKPTSGQAVPVPRLEDAAQRSKFLAGDTRVITVPGGKDKVKYDPLQRIGVGISRLGTSEAVAVGAYAFAVHALDKQ